MSFNLIEGDVVLYDADGNPLVVAPNTSIPGSTKALLVVGEDAAGTARLLQTEVGGELKQVLYDSVGNAIGVVLDGSVYRIQGDSKVAKGASSLVHLEALDTATGKGRLKATLYSPEGEAIAFGSVPPSADAIYNGFVKNGSSDDLLVDGSVTPVEFTYNAHPTQDISLQAIEFVLASNSVTFGNDYFGAVAGPLANGLIIEVTGGGATGTIENVKQNEDFVHFASPGGFEWVVSSKDMLSAKYLVGGALKLEAGTSDKVKVTVRDDIDSAGVYFKCFVKGNLLSS